VFTHIASRANAAKTLHLNKLVKIQNDFSVQPIFQSVCTLTIYALQVCRSFFCDCPTDVVVSSWNVKTFRTSVTAIPKIQRYDNWIQLCNNPPQNIIQRYILLTSKELTLQRKTIDRERERIVSVQINNLPEDFWCLSKPEVKWRRLN